MQENERKQLDEKTVLLIEQTDESLRKMEKTLGPDHPVVGKILDTYAKLLRQNNHRVLDAINMEARAKAIRAKHNQEESEAQAKVFEDGESEPKHQQRPLMSAGRLKLFFWVIVVILAGTVTVSGMRTVKTVGKHDVKTKTVKSSALKKTEGTNEVGSGDSTVAAEAQSSAPTGAPADQASEQQTVQSSAPLLRRAEEQDNGDTAGIKEEIAQLAKHGQEYADAGNAADAEESFKTAITIATQASSPGKPFASPELVLVFDQYATILEAKGASDKADAMRNNAKGVQRVLDIRAAASQQ